VAANALASRPSLDAVLDTLADLVLQAVEHECVMVSLWDEADSTLTVAASKGENKTPVGLRFDLDHLSEQARRTVEARQTQLVDYDALPAGERGIGDTVPSHLALDVPLLYRECLLGLLVVDDPSGSRPFSEREIELVQGIAAEAAVAIENARLYETQRRIATTFQENLVHPLPEVPGLELASLSLPASQPELVGGDFHDVFRVANDRVVVLIGDVMGKGVKAAGLTETVHSAVRALALVTGSPAEILRHVNRLLLSEDSEQYASALIIMLDPGSGHAKLASAGHLPPILLANSAAELVEPPYGPLLGALDSLYEVREFELEPGATLLLYTDGLTEARRHAELFGEQRLLETLGAASDLAPPALVEQLRDTVLGYAGTLQDDLEILALRRQAQGA
jgi:serine phosphatase RsbU (regulator of sigma subunit)